MARSTMVYPRVCGGTEYSRCGGSHEPGLSPRVRGNPRRGDASRVHRGSIPACAGEPSQGDSRGNLDRVYPRVCGGTCRRQHHGGPAGGLSPRVRGNLMP